MPLKTFEIIGASLDDVQCIIAGQSLWPQILTLDGVKVNDLDRDGWLAAFTRIVGDNAEATYITNAAGQPVAVDPREREEVPEDDEGEPEPDPVPADGDPDPDPSDDDTDPVDPMPDPAA